MLTQTRAIQPTATEVDITDDAARQLGIVASITATVPVSIAGTVPVSIAATVATDPTDDLTRLLGTTRDWWLNEIRAGRAFMYSAQCAISAGNFSVIQLKNPAASGKTLLVKRAVVTFGVGGQFNIIRADADLLTLTGNSTTNLLVGGAAGVGQVRRENPAGLPGTIIGQAEGLAQTPHVLIDDWGWELGEGEALCFAHGAIDVRVHLLALGVEV